MNTEKSKKNYYAWVIFGICFLMIFVALGFGSYTKSTFLSAITNQLGLERSLYTIADSCRYITAAVMYIFLGRTVGKIGLRRMAGFGFGFLALSFTVNSLASEYWQFYIGGALLGAGLSWTTNSMAGYLVENWFSNGKGTVMGVLMAANGLGGFASEFIITKIIYGINGDLSYADCRWRTAYAVIAGLFLVTGILAVLLIRDNPSDLGLAPLGRDRVRKAGRGSDWDGIGMSELLKKPYFYVSAVCVFLTGFVLQSMVNMAKTYMYDLGFDKNYVMLVFACHSLVLMASKTLAGIGYDTIGMRKTFFSCCLCAIVALGALYLLTTELPALAWIYSIVGSFGLPLETVIIPLLVSYLVGRKSYKKVLGYFMAVNSAGYACGLPISNLAYDLQGTYKNMIFILIIVMTLCAIAQQFAMGAADREKRGSS